jgi:hypothetical protein
MDGNNAFCPAGSSLARTAIKTRLESGVPCRVVRHRAGAYLPIGERRDRGSAGNFRSASLLLRDDGLRVTEGRLKPPQEIRTMAKRLSAKAFGEIATRLAEENHSLREENTLLRMLLRAQGLTEEQIHKQVEDAGYALRSHEHANRLFERIAEAFLEPLEDQDTEEALRKFPGTGKPQ